MRIKSPKNSYSLLSSKLPIAALIILIFLLFTSSMAYSQANQGGQDPGYVEVFEISGLLDDVLADALDNAISAAERNNANALILQVNSKQAVISDSKLMEIANHIQSSVIPIEVWVGPSGSTACLLYTSDAADE